MKEKSQTFSGSDFAFCYYGKVHNYFDITERQGYNPRQRQ